MNSKIIEIKRILRERRITYKELSKQTNIPEGTLKNIFSGFTKNPRIDTIQSIETALSIHESNNLKENNIVKDYITTNEEEVLSIYRQLSDANKEVILKNLYILLDPDDRKKYDVLRNIK